MFILNRVIFLKIQQYNDIDLNPNYFITNITSSTLSNEEILHNRQLLVNIENKHECVICSICNPNTDYFCNNCINYLKQIYINSPKENNVLLDKFCNKLYWGWYCSDYIGFGPDVGCFACVLSTIFDNNTNIFGRYADFNMLQFINKLTSSSVSFNNVFKKSLIYNLTIETTKGIINIEYIGDNDINDSSCSRYIVNKSTFNDVNQPLYA